MVETKRLQVIIATAALDIDRVEPHRFQTVKSIENEPNCHTVTLGFKSSCQKSKFDINSPIGAKNRLKRHGANSPRSFWVSNLSNKCNHILAAFDVSLQEWLKSFRYLKKD